MEKKMINKKNFKPGFKKKSAGKNPHTYVKPTEMRAGAEFEYKMPRGIYEDMRNECAKAKAGDLQTYLCKYVNGEYGLLGTCVRVIVE